MLQVDARKEFANIDAQNKALLARELDRTFQAAMRTFADAARITLRSKPAFQRGHHALHQQVLHDAVAEGQRVDEARFGVGDGEGAALARRIRARVKFVGEQGQQIGAIERKERRGACAAFSTNRTMKRAAKGWEVGEVEGMKP